MNRIQIEATLNTDRAWLLETYAAMPPEDLNREVSQSEHDPATMWTALDHFSHLARIELNFNQMIRRHMAGDPNPVGLMNDADGTPRPRAEIMAGVNAMTEKWALKHRGKSLSEVVALGQSVRAETLALLAELTDAQLEEKLPGAPWADGTIGGVLAANAGHGRTHFSYVKAGLTKHAAVGGA